MADAKAAEGEALPTDTPQFGCVSDYAAELAAQEPKSPAPTKSTTTTAPTTVAAPSEIKE